MFREEDFIEKAKVVKNEIRSQLNQRSIRYNWHEPDVTVLEGFLARGDRRCADVILKAYEKGALYDAWSESFHYDIWKEAFRETGVDIEFYTLRERSTDEILPWDFIDAGVTKKFLIREWEQAQSRNRNTKLPSEMLRLRCTLNTKEVCAVKVRIKFAKTGHYEICRTSGHYALFPESHPPC